MTGCPVLGLWRESSEGMGQSVGSANTASLKGEVWAGIRAGTDAGIDPHAPAVAMLSDGQDATRWETYRNGPAAR